MKRLTFRLIGRRAGSVLMMKQTVLALVMTALAWSFGQRLAFGVFTLSVSEIWPGNTSSTNLSEDWFEITNSGDTAWVAATDGDLWYDDSSPIATNAILLAGVPTIPAGGSAVYVIGSATDASNWMTLWSSTTPGPLTLFPVGTATGGARLAQAGDAVNIWVTSTTPAGAPNFGASLPNTNGHGGQSFDVALGAFSVIGNGNYAVATTALSANEAAVGSPGVRPAAPFNIFKWEYIDPNNPSLGKQESDQLTVDGYGLHAQPDLNASGKNLSMAYLAGADLTGATLHNTNLTNAELSGANLTGAQLNSATLAGANFGGTEVRGAVFSRDPVYETYGGITPDQLYATGSYTSHDLSSIVLDGNQLAGTNFAGQNLTNASFGGATLTDADFAGAEVRGASFSAYYGPYYKATGITLSQLSSTASYAAHDLSGIDLGGNNLAGANFAGQNLTNASFHLADVSGANLTGAVLTGAGIGGGNFNGAGLTLEQIYSTGSYQSRFLDYIGLAYTDLADANFSGKYLSYADFSLANLSGANFDSATLNYANLTGADLSLANLYFASLSGANLSGADLSEAVMTGARVDGVNFSNSNITLAQLYSTDTYLDGRLWSIGFADFDLTGADFANKTLGGANFSSANLSGADLTNADVSSVNFTGANLSGTSFYGARVENANFSGSGLTLDQLYSTANYSDFGYLNGIGLANADLSGADFSSKFLSGANLSSANLSFAYLANTSFDSANLSGANLEGAVLDGANVENANFSGSNLTLAQLYSTGSYQTTVTNGSMRGIGLANTDLTGADFSNKDLTNANFSSANLSGANLTNTRFDYATVAGANLSGAEVRGASFLEAGITPAQLYTTASYLARDLSGIDLGASNLADANFAGLNLTNATFYSANLTGASFSGANLTNAGLKYANLTNADFTGADVRGADFDLGSTSLTPAQLASTASYQARDLSGISLFSDSATDMSFANQNLTGAGLYGTFTRANFSHANLTSASLSGANFTGANLDGAILTGADIFNANLSSTHITLDQLYSTASYQEYGLYGVRLVGNDLSGANFADKSLVSTDFYAAKLVGANFSNANLSAAEFINADLSGANLAGANLAGGSLALANLTGADLTNADLTGANLIGANLAGADIRGTSLSRVIYPGTPGEYLTCKYCWGGIYYEPGTEAYSAGTGVSLAQLVSTANYGAHDLSDVKFVNNNLAGGNFAGFNLTNSSFAGTTLTGANFSSADARGAIGLGWVTASNFVRQDGHIAGLNLSAGQALSIRDYDGNPFAGSGPIPITVDQRLVIGSGGVLRMEFEADAWDSTISFATGIPVTLGGTLELAFAVGVDPIGQIGRMFDLFDWTGVSPAGTFTVDTSYVWDLANLYTTGEVIFLATSSLQGDFNGDNRVDAGDYTVWRDGANSHYFPDDYTVWKNNFGATLGSGGIAALPSPSVPEPTTFFLLSIGLVATWMTRGTCLRDVAQLACRQLDQLQNFRVARVPNPLPFSLFGEIPPEFSQGPVPSQRRVAVLLLSGVWRSVRSAFTSASIG